MFAGTFIKHPMHNKWIGLNLKQEESIPDLLNVCLFCGKMVILLRCLFLRNMGKISA